MKETLKERDSEIIDLRCQIAKMEEVEVRKTEDFSKIEEQVSSLSTACLPT